MSVFSVTIKRMVKGKVKKVKVWRYDFQFQKKHYQSRNYETKTIAQEEERKRKEELIHPKIDIIFIDLVNIWLDKQKAYRAHRHYIDCVYMVKRWIKRWDKLNCKGITRAMIQEWILERSIISPSTGNKELKYLRALFNFGINQKIINCENPTLGIDFLPTEKFIKYVPPIEDVIKVIWQADQDQRDYLFCIWDLKARMSEINQLHWKDVDMERKVVTLYTRKKKGGNLTPRAVPMTNRLYKIFLRRNDGRDKSKSWIFWHKYISSKTKEVKEGPYTDHNKFMKTLCRKAGVKYFRFHALRHSGASIMGNDPSVNIGSIQRILGHESHRTTEIYLHSIGEAERKAIDRFEEVTEGMMDKGEHKKDSEMI